jgi:hypothetical protein
MRWQCSIWLLIVLTLTACGSGRKSGRPAQSFPANGTPPETSTSAPHGTIVTPARPKSGRITLVNPSSRYVIVTFSLGQLPARESRLQVYRDGLRVAELRVTDFTRDINAVADIVAGECQVGDEVREN